MNGTEIKVLAKSHGVGKNAVDAVLRECQSQPGKGSERLYFLREEGQPAEQAA